MAKNTEMTIPEPAAIEISPGPGALLSAIVSLAKDPSVDVAKLQALLNMQERMESRQSEAEFNRAFHDMEAKLPRIKKNGEVEYKGAKAFKFAKWEDVDASIRPILREHGFSLSFNTGPRQGDGGGLVITGELLHTAGHSKKASIPLPLDSSGGKNNLQGAGSTFSYGARYVTRMLLNIITEGDDDSGVRGGMVFITPEHQAEIQTLIGETKTDVARFLAVMSPESHDLSEVDDRDFTRLRNALAQKKVQMEKKS